MLKWLIWGLAMAGGTKSCEGKHETSAPHTNATLTVAGVATQEIPREAFADGWALRYDRFRLAPTFGLDETSDNRKNDGYVPITGRDAYGFGAGVLDLTTAGATPMLEGRTISGRSSGWGMHLRRFPSEQEGSVPSEPSLEVAGEATGPGGERVRFAWGFVTELWFAHCVPKGQDVVVLPVDGALDLQIELDGRALFGGGGAQPLRFAPFAAADRDADGQVTIAELRASPASEVELGEESASSGSLYDVLQGRLERLVSETYTCQVEVDDCQDKAPVLGVGDIDKAEKDADGDGLSNRVDPDIDGDGLANEVDCDPNTTLDSLADCDGSDRHEKDSDGDGLRNCEDSDIDGDGIPNEYDGRPYRSPYELSTK